MKAPLVDTVIASDHIPSTRSVSITFGAVDRTEVELAFSAKCVPLAIMALTLELSRLIEKLPDEETIDAQGVRVVGSELAMTDDGSIALMLTLFGGAHLPLELDTAHLLSLRNQIDEAVRLSDAATRH